MPSLLAALCLAGASSSPAHSAALPSYDVFYGVGIEGYGDQSSQSFGKKSMSNDFGSALAITGTGPSPFVKLELSSSDTSYGAHDASAFGQLGYYLRVTGPAGVSVPVQVSASGSITYSAANANITAELKIVRQFFSTPLLERSLCHHSLTCGTNFIDSFSLDKEVMSFVAGAQYYVSMVTQATVMTSESNSGKATVYLDPYFEIDPSTPNASAFSLEFSPGIVQAPVPEPGIWGLWLAGLGVIAGIAKRRTARLRA